MARTFNTPVQPMSGDDRTLVEGLEPTVLMPAPGGQATVVMRRRTPPRAAAASAGVELQRLVAGINPLLGAASVLLALVPQLRATTRHDDPVGLRVQLLQCLTEFATLAAAAGGPRPKVTAARYGLCTSVDEAIPQTPWGAPAAWAGNGLLPEFHDRTCAAS